MLNQFKQEAFKLHNKSSTFLASRWNASAFMDYHKVNDAAKWFTVAICQMMLQNDLLTIFVKLCYRGSNSL